MLKPNASPERVPDTTSNALLTRRMFLRAMFATALAAGTTAGAREPLPETGAIERDKPVEGAPAELDAFLVQHHLSMEWTYARDFIESVRVNGADEEFAYDLRGALDLDTIVATERLTRHNDGRIANIYAPFTFVTLGTAPRIEACITIRRGIVDVMLRVIDQESVSIDVRGYGLGYATQWTKAPSLPIGRHAVELRDADGTPLAATHMNDHGIATFDIRTLMAPTPYSFAFIDPLSVRPASRERTPLENEWNVEGESWPEHA